MYISLHVIGHLSCLIRVKTTRAAIALESLFKCCFDSGNLIIIYYEIVLKLWADGVLCVGVIETHNDGLVWSHLVVEGVFNETLSRKMLFVFFECIS